MARTGRHIEVQGLRHLNRDLRRLKSKGLMNELRAAHKKASVRAAIAASQEAPVKSGKLQLSIKARPSNREGKVKAGSPKRVPYAGVIHFGWRKRGIEANQFIYRGIKRVLPEIQRDYEKDVQRILSKLGKRFKLK